MGNTASNYNIIRVTPTLDTSAYAQGDVLFTATAIPNAVRGNGGCSKLVSMYVLNQLTTDVDIAYIFSEGSTALGTINATANISDANLEALNINGFLHQDASEAGTLQLDNADLHKVYDAPDNGTPLLLQAAADTTTVYVQGILTGSATPTYAADDIDLILHIQYR